MPDPTGDDAVVEQLQRYAAAVGDEVPRRASARRRRRPAPALVAAALAVLALVAATVALVGRDGDEGDDVSAAGPAAPEATLGPGTWSELAEMPIPGRTGAVVVAGDDELLVWGGRGDRPLGDGAAYSFAEGTWRVLAPSPLSPRSGAIGVWTGDEMLVWGGETAEGASGEGAAYDPTSDTWRTLPANPGVGQVGATAGVWTGERFALVGVQGPPGSSMPSDAYELDPTSGVWESLPPVPTLGGGHEVVWTDEELVVLSTDDVALATALARLGVGADAWEPVPVEVDPLRLGGRDMAVDAGRLIVAGLVVDLETGSSTPVEPPPSGASGSSNPTFDVAALGAGLVTNGVVVTDVDAATSEMVAALPGGPREFPSTAAAGGRYYVVGGDGCGYAASCVSFVAAGPPLVWSPEGTPPPAVATPPGVPAMGTWTALASAPLSNREGSVVVATDEELLVWGGNSLDGMEADGAAYAFETGEWRTIGPSPLTARTAAIGVWTGEEVVVLGGDTASGPATGAAAYEPSTDRWRELSPEVVFGSSPAVGAAWDGEQVVVVGGPASAATDAVALDPTSGALEALPPSGLGASEIPVTVTVLGRTDAGTVALRAGAQPDVVRRAADGSWSPVSAARPGTAGDPALTAIAGEVALVGGTALVDLATGDTRAVELGDPVLPGPPVVALDDGTIVAWRSSLQPGSARWQATAPPPERSGVPSTVTHDDVVYAIGGDGCAPDTRCGGPDFDAWPELRLAAWTPGG